MLSKRGQVTVFIIIALVIVGVVVLIYFLFSDELRGGGFDSNNPNHVLDDCLGEFADGQADLIASRGGSLNPENYFTFRGGKIRYLCYTREDYHRCLVQEPFLRSRFETELKNAVSEKADQCLDGLEEVFQRKGYETNLEGGDVNVELRPERINVSFDGTLTLTRGEDVRRYENLHVLLNNNVYELLFIANSIVDWEASYGDAEVTVYMTYYRNLKVEKWKQSDGTSVYTLTDRNGGKTFRFASRSIAWPPGYVRS